jgi:hypothetical protein
VRSTDSTHCVKLTCTGCSRGQWQFCVEQYLLCVTSCTDVYYCLRTTNTKVVYVLLVKIVSNRTSSGQPTGRDAISSVSLAAGNNWPTLSVSLTRQLAVVPLFASFPAKCPHDRETI